MTLSVLKLSAETKPHFYRVNCEDNGLGWCHCVAWWCESWDEFRVRTAEENGAQRERLFREGQYDGFVLYEDDQPVGWSQVGPRDRLPNLVKMYELELDPQAWAITCLALTPHIRGKGYGEKFVRLIVEQLQAQKVTRINAFPKRGAKDAWTGPEKIFARCGFTIVRDHESFPIYERVLE